MKNNKKIVLIFFIIFINISYSQTYSIDVKKLNVREKPDQNSRVIGSFSKNDTVNTISEERDWLKVENNNKIGYISKKYVTAQKNEKSKIENGFIPGFKKVFLNSFLLICLVLFTYQTYKRRIADSRYKTGYRNGKFSIREYITYGTYSLIFSLIIGIISGVTSWIATF
jgi:hypothetical protein